MQDAAEEVKVESPEQKRQRFLSKYTLTMEKDA